MRKNQDLILMAKKSKMTGASLTTFTGSLQSDSFTQNTCAELCLNRLLQLSAFTRHNWGVKVNKNEPFNDFPGIVSWRLQWFWCSTQSMEHTILISISVPSIRFQVYICHLRAVLCMTRVSGVAMVSGGMAVITGIFSNLLDCCSIFPLKAPKISWHYFGTYISWRNLGARKGLPLHSLPEKKR